VLLVISVVVLEANDTALLVGPWWVLLGAADTGPGAGVFAAFDPN